MSSIILLEVQILAKYKPLYLNITHWYLWINPLLAHTLNLGVQKKLLHFRYFSLRSNFCTALKRYLLLRLFCWILCLSVRFISSNLVVYHLKGTISNCPAYLLRLKKTDMIVVKNIFSISALNILLDWSLESGNNKKCIFAFRLNKNILLVIWHK